jgi:hypothetical protein
MEGTGPTGQQVAVLAGQVDVTTFGTLSQLVPTTQDAAVSVSNLQALWLTGYELSCSTGTVLLQSVWFAVSGGTWRVNVTLCALTSGVTDAAVKVFYAYSA